MLHLKGLPQPSADTSQESRGVASGPVDVSRLAGGPFPAILQSPGKPGEIGIRFSGPADQRRGNREHRHIETLAVKQISIDHRPQSAHDGTGTDAADAGYGYCLDDLFFHSHAGLPGEHLEDAPIDSVKEDLASHDLGSAGEPGDERRPGQR